MSLIKDLESLTVDDIENVEKLTLRWIFLAILDFGIEAYDIFRYSPDEVRR